MKLNISDPIIVSRGPDARTAGWGVFQFPDLTRLDENTILCKYANGADSNSEYGKKQENNCRISYDLGKTWEPVVLEDYDAVRGLPLDNGDKVFFVQPQSVPAQESWDLGEPAGFVKRKAQLCFHIENVSRDICENTWILARTKPGADKPELERVTLNWPNMVLRLCRGLLVPPITMGKLRKGPDGTLWMTNYDIGNGPWDNKFTGFLANYLFKSTDNGHTWDLAHYLPYDPADIPHPDADNWEGFGENDITYAPNGDLVRIIRTNGSLHKGVDGAGLLYTVRSSDGGKTWTEPKIFDKLGVWPRLLTLGCGVTLASYGRPGLYVRATDDPACEKWEDPIELIHSEFETLTADVTGVGTCSYTDMIALDDRTALLAHTDFNIKDENGVPRKTVVVRYITVE